MTKETKIGMTALLLFLAIGIAALLLHPMERLFPTTFPVYAVFDDAQGITPGASVLHAGVKVGRLKAITIEEGKAVLHLEIDRKATIPKDAAFSITTSGLIGDTYVTASAGDHTAGTLASGATIENVAKMLGHSDTKMTRHYARILDSSILRDMQTVAKNMAL